MDVKELVGLIIAFVAVTGGLGIAALAIYVSMNKEKEEKLARMEAKHKEKLAMIEKGMDPSVLDIKSPSNPQQAALIWGLLLGSVGFGMFLGYMVAVANGWSHAALMNAFALFFGGLGLIVFYIINRMGAKKKAE